MIPLQTSQLIPLDSANPLHLRAMVEIWNIACGESLAITEHFAAFNLRPAPGVTQQGWLVVDDKRKRYSRSWQTSSSQRNVFAVGGL